MGVLAKQEAEILLNGGLDVSTGAEVQAVQTLRQADDVRTGDDGELVKRPKTASTQNVVNPGGVGVYAGLGAAGLIESRGEVYVATDNYGVMTEQGRYVSAGGGNISVASVPYAVTNVPKLARVSRLEVDRVSGDTNERGIQTSASCVYDGNTLVLATVVAGTTYPSLRLQALDLETGAVIAHVQYDAPSSTIWHVDACAHNAASDPGAVITVASGLGASPPYTAVKYRYRANTRDFVRDGNLVTDLASIRHRIKASATTGRFWLAYETNSTLLKAAEVDALTGALVTTHIGTHSASGGVDIVTLPSQTCIVSAEQATSPKVYAEIFGSPSLATTLWTEAASVFNVAVTGARQTGSGNASQVAVFVSTLVPAAGVVPAYYRVTSVVVDASSTTTAKIGTQVTQNQVRLVGYGTTVDDRAYALLIPSYTVSQEIPAPCWVRHEQFTATSGGAPRPVARVAHDTYYSEPEFLILLVDYLHSTWTVGQSLYATLPTGRSASPVFGGAPYQAQVVSLSRVDLDPEPATFAKKDEVALVATGIPFEIDGERASITQPYHRPVVTLDYASSGSTSVANTISVIAIYTWVDAANRLHRSAPSRAVATGSFSNKQLDVYVSELPFAPFTEAPPARQYSVELYVTENNGSVYYRALVSGVAHMAYAQVGGFRLFSDVKVGTSSIGIVGLGNTVLYSSGAGSEELTSQPTPPFHAITTVGDRMFAIDAEDRSRVWFSKPIVAGFAPEWNTANTLFIGGQGVGVSDIGGIPTVFARDGIYQIYGDGPNSLGSGSFAPARKLPHAVECLDALSVCKTPIGVLFRARRGVSLLANDGSLQPIGNSIDQALLVSGIPSGYCKITYDELSEEVHVLDFDRAHYVFSVRGGKWSKWTQSVSFQDWEDCVAVNGQLFALHRGSSADALIRLASRDEADHRRHTGSGWSLQTPWIRFDGVTGNLRIWELIVQLRTGTPASGTTLGGAVTVTYETRDGASESFTWTPSEIYTEASGATERTINLRCRLASQRTRSFRVTIAEASPAYEYDGHVPIAMRVHYGVSPGGERKKTQAQNRGG